MDEGEPLYYSLKGITEGFISQVVEEFSRVEDNPKEDFLGSLYDYSKWQYNKHKESKTILYRKEARPISEFYVDLDINTNGHRIDSSNTERLLNVDQRIAFTGEAGSGKSTLSEKLYLDLYESEVFSVPIYVKLRHIDEGQSILSHITEKVNDHSNGFRLEHLRFLLEKGRALLMLDGYDETNKSIREEIESEIINISNIYNETRVLVFSRPNEDVMSWQDFNITEVDALSKEQAIDVIRKLEYDKHIKDKFIQELREGLFHSHKEFLSNPLLLTIMLMVYGTGAEVPEKMHNFYERAFSVLYSEHDAKKEAWSREKYTSLPIDEFKDVLSSFAFITYIKSGNSFGKSKALQFINKSKDITKVEFDAEMYFKDLKESICLILREGINFKFAHRSFQEYFSAHFLSQWKSEDRPKVMQRIFSHSPEDSVLKLLHNINERITKSEYFLPIIREIKQKIEEIGIEENPVEVCNIFIDGIRINKSREDRRDLNFSISVDREERINYGLFFIQLNTLLGLNTEPVRSEKYIDSLPPKYEDTNIALSLSEDKSEVENSFDIKDLAKSYKKVILESEKVLSKEINSVDENINDVVPF